MNDKPSYETLAQFLSSLQGYDMLPEHERALLGQAAEAIRHLTMFKISHDEWMAKTDWVQKTARAGELGMHRADVLKQRIDALCDVDNVWVVMTGKGEHNHVRLRRRGRPGDVLLSSTTDGLIVDLYTDSGKTLSWIAEVDEDLRCSEEN